MLFKGYILKFSHWIWKNQNHHKQQLQKKKKKNRWKLELNWVIYNKKCNNHFQLKKVNQLKLMKEAHQNHDNKLTQN